MIKILISACLLGQKVRYDGEDCLQANARLQAWLKAGKVIAICPEVAGGLSTPRPPAEIQTGKTAKEVLLGSGKVITVNGNDVSAEFISGAQRALQLAQQHKIRVAVLKARSPSCGSKQVYDGTYSRSIISGMGVTAELLSQHGVQVFDENELDKALDMAERLQDEEL